MVVAPVEELDYDVIGVNSAKAANYVIQLIIYNQASND